MSDSMPAYGLWTIVAINSAFILIMAGFVLQWPTLPTLLMSPVLVVMYFRLARREEAEALSKFGDRWSAYAAVTPGFFPGFGYSPRKPLAPVR